MKPKQAHIVYKCNDCKYKTNYYHNPLKVKLIFLEHILYNHGLGSNILNYENGITKYPRGNEE